MFISGSFHLGRKARNAAGGEPGGLGSVTIVRKWRFLGLEGAVSVCVCFLCQMDKGLRGLGNPGTGFYASSGGWSRFGGSCGAEG